MFSILVDIFYPLAGTVFSKEGVFQQPRLLTTTIPEPPVAVAVSHLSGTILRPMPRARQTAVLLLVLLLLTVVGVHLYAQVFRWRAEHLLAQLKTFRVEETPAATVLKLGSDYSLHVVGDAPCSEAHCAFSIELTEWGSLVKARRPWNERLIDYLTTGRFRFFGLRVYDLTVEFRI